MQDSKCANLHNNRNQILLVAILQSNQQQFYQEMCSINESLIQWGLSSQEQNSCMLSKENNGF